VKCRSIILTIIITIISTIAVQAYHIIGGEIYYEYIGGNQYRVTLKLYRDCSAANGAPFDEFAKMGAFDINGNLVHQFSLPFPGSSPVDYSLNNPCAGFPPNLCIEVAVYSSIITFPNIPPGGLQFSYQRCCRNSTIVNINEPDNVGSTYTARIPGNGVNNNSAFFNFLPPIVVCANVPLVVNSSATDPDGDSLVYSLCNPFTGASQMDPEPTVPTAPPYQSVQFIPPYSVNNMLGGTPPMSINSQTGIITANPINIGQFVAAVCVKEFRNGVFLNENRRDFQINVVDCSPLVVAQFTPTNNSIVIGQDSLLICGSLEVDLVNNSVGQMNRKWDFGDTSTGADTSSLNSPTYTYPDTGTYNIQLIVNPGTTCADTAYRTLVLRYGVVADFTVADGCENVPLVFNDNSSALDGFIDEWSWNFNNDGNSTEQDPLFAFFSPGTKAITLTAVSNYGCSSTVMKNVIIHPTPVVIAGPDTFVCNIDTVTLFAEDAVNYQWQPNYEMTNTAVQFPKVNPQVSTTYTVSVTNEFGCAGKDSAIILVTDTVIATAGTDTMVCVGRPVPLFSSNAVYYRWSPEPLFQDYTIQNPVVEPAGNTTYYVYSYIGSCFDLDSVQVQTLPLPVIQAVEPQTINQGESAILSAIGNAADYYWYPVINLDDPYAPITAAAPLQTTTYYVLGVDSNGCLDRDSTIIYVTKIHELYVPNAFSPNGDGINDFFNFYTKGIKRILSVSVFNRWGEQVFYSESEKTYWDGTFKGKPQESNVFVYQIIAETFDDTQIIKKGNLSLLR